MVSQSVLKVTTRESKLLTNMLIIRRNNSTTLISKLYNNVSMQRYSKRSRSMIQIVNNNNINSDMFALNKNMAKWNNNSLMQLRLAHTSNNSNDNSNILNKHSKRMSEILSKKHTEPVLGYKYYNETSSMIKEIQELIDNGTVIDDKKIPILSNLFSNALSIISNVELKYDNNDTTNPVATVDGSSRFDICISILTTLHNLNLDISQQSFASTIKAGCLDGKYNDAAELFMSQLDIVDCGSMVPMHFDNTTYDCPIEIGLYAIAKSNCSTEDDDDDDTSSMKVFDAALTMAIVNPTDYNKYMIAAINALGYAGDYKPCIDFLNTDEGKKVGQPLINAVMKSCIVCQEYNKAIDIYEDLLQNEILLDSEEWQIAGRYYNIDPDCHNTALIAYQYIINEHPIRAKNQAYSIFSNAVTTQRHLTIDAIQSILNICHKMNDWTMSINVLEQLLYHKSFSFDHENNIPDITSTMVSSIISTCITSNQHIIALLSLYFTQIHLYSSNNKLPQQQNVDDNSIDDEFVHKVSAWSILQQQRQQFNNDNSILSSTMNILFNIGQYKKAILLYDHIVTNNNDNNNEIITCKDSKQIYEEAKIKLDENQSSTSDLAWNELFMYLDQLFIKEKMQTTSTKQELLAKCIKLCTELNQKPIVWYYITRWLLANTLYMPKNIDDIVIPTYLKYPLHNDDIMFQNNNHDNNNIVIEYLSNNDNLLSSIMESYRKNGNINNAINLYFDKMEQIDDNNKGEILWKQSTFQCLLSFIDTHDVDKAYNFFLHMKKGEYTTQSIVAIARLLNDNERWDDIATVWRIAVNNFCLSEEIGLIALKAVSRSDQFQNQNIQQYQQQHQEKNKYNFNNELQMKISLFRIIKQKMGDITNKEPYEWAKSHYWRLKKDLLPKDIRRLFKWKDGEIKQNEMKIAIVDFMNYSIQFDNNNNDDSNQQQPKPMDKDILLSIIQKAGYQQRHVRCRGNPIPDKKDESERIIQYNQRQEGIDIILKVLDHLQKHNNNDNNNNLSNLLYDAYFTLQVAKGLRALNANELVIEYVRNLVLLQKQQINNNNDNNTIDIRPMTYLQAVFAATSSNDQEAKDEILQYMNNAGLTFDIDKEMLRMRHATSSSSSNSSTHYDI